LGCCGAPAQWAGQPDRFAATLRQLKEGWAGLGRPRVIAACSSCYRTLKDNLHEMEVESLWSVLESSPLLGLEASPRRLALHDPCGTRGAIDVQNAVRRLLTRMGVTVEELNERDQMTCCGFGGLAQFANPEVADKIVRRRIGQNDADYVTYCAMCRDRFARQGKRTWHVLDLVFAAGEDVDCGDAGGRADPGFSSRQENRARLKRRFLREVWREEMPEEQSSLELLISPDVASLLEARMILREDVRAVIQHAERSGEKLEDPATGHFVARHRPASATFWVEYSVEHSAYRVHNAYSHRMQVE
jgi:hypothetical protein